MIVIVFLGGLRLRTAAAVGLWLVEILHVIWDNIQNELDLPVGPDMQWGGDVELRLCLAGSHQLLVAVVCLGNPKFAYSARLEMLGLFVRTEGCNDMKQSVLSPWMSGRDAVLVTVKLSQLSSVFGPIWSRCLEGWLVQPVADCIVSIACCSYSHD